MQSCNYNIWRISKAIQVFGPTQFSKARENKDSIELETFQYSLSAHLKIVVLSSA